MLSRSASRSITVRMRDDVGEVLARNAFDAKAALADRVDEAARDEARQRLAQRRRADAEARRHLGDAEPRAGRKRAGHDVGFDALGGALGLRFRAVAREASRQDDFVEIDLGLQHVLLFHRLDPPGEIGGLQSRAAKCRAG